MAAWQQHGGTMAAVQCHWWQHHGRKHGRGGGQRGGGGCGRQRVGSATVVGMAAAAAATNVLPLLVVGLAMKTPAATAMLGHRQQSAIN